MKNLLCIIMFLFGVIGLRAESNQNQIYLELAGHGIMYSLNYERMISEDFAVRAGASSWKFGVFENDKDNYLIFPLTLSIITGETRHHHEFGAGVDFLFRNNVSENEKEKFIVPIAFAAYRYHYASGWVFRGSFTPFYDTEDEKIIPFFGLSFGISF